MLRSGKIREQDMASLARICQAGLKVLIVLCHHADTAETLIRNLSAVHRSVDRYNGSCKYMCGFVRFQTPLVSELAPRNKAKSAEFSDNDLFGAAMEEKVILSQEKFQLFRLLHLLNEPMREIMYLRLTGEFSFKEIGEILGKDETWARVNFYRGKQKLHEQKLQEEKPQEPEPLKRERQK